MIYILSSDGDLMGPFFKMLLRNVFFISLSQLFMTQFVCNLESKGTFFKQVSGVPNSATNDEISLPLTSFGCGIDADCYTVVESHLGKIEQKGAVWSKVKEPEFILISRGKETKQSTTAKGGVSSRAVDGSIKNSWNGGSCTHTNGLESAPHWWRVDFARRVMISKVVITNRGDCCHSRLSNFTIRIGFVDTINANPICRKNVGIHTGITVEFKCNEVMTGRYVYIESHLKAALTLCEVQVYGYYF